ncbi:Putative aldehyde dehydrogenase domain, aldehyde/histidinol dehydrogenase [Septoria linicola]|uniref:aldehyde dehydrogenase (NAD(+)) n=1 Tax=Septoria linicola TaxID=215465 RepID=A0A9Q9AP96_9PEZI|nr:Putative aldehyde dehydrogenase domain, aldehyde/histidinol dehydrogenase [Septoria linicola]
MASIQWDSFYNIVDGKQRNGEQVHNAVNPRTKEQLWNVPIASEQDVNDAVTAAEKAFKEWRLTTLEHRQNLMQEFIKLWIENKEHMVEILMKENGKSRIMAHGECDAVTAWWDYYSKIEMPVEQHEDDTKIVKTVYKPLGVSVGISPWNFPLVLSLAFKVAPAIVAGCPIIIKPSPFTPYTAAKGIELAQQIFPPGLIQCLGGDDKLGPMLTVHPGVKKVSFTGSTATGKKVMEACSKTLKRVVLELGGNDPAVVCEDVDVKATAAECAMGAWFNTGQMCVCTKRVLVHEKIYEEFLNEMIAFTKTLSLEAEGHSMLGPVQNQMQYEKVLDIFKDSKKNGHKFVHGDSEPKPSDGFFITPTIIDNPPSDSIVWKEEPFGPIVPVQPWNDEQDVIRRCNDSDTGLGACVYAKDVERAERIAAQIDSGTVWINSYEKPSPDAYFNGLKQSGLSGENGVKGMLSYCNQTVIQRYKKNVNHL